MNGYVHSLAVALGIAAMAGCADGAAPAVSAANAKSGVRESVVVAGLPSPPVILASDGTTIFFVNAAGSTLAKVAATGGPVEKLFEGKIGNRFLTADDANVYFEEVGDATRLLRVPKAGGPPVVVGKPEVNGLITAATTLGGRAFWVEVIVGPGAGRVVKSALLPGGPVTLQGRLDEGSTGDALGVTRTAAFLGGRGDLAQLPLDSGATVRGAPTPVAGAKNCDSLLSDADAVFCLSRDGAILRVASDGTSRAIGPEVERPAPDVVANLAVDATDLYWVEGAESGKVMRMPKSGNGVSAVLSRGRDPMAIAVDGSAVYWSDRAGRIVRLVK